MLENFHFPISKQQLAGPATLVGLSLIFAIVPFLDPQRFAFEQEAIANGEYWRLLTGHFLHTNNIHLVLNWIGIVLLWGLHGDYYQAKYYLAQFLVFALGCSAGLYLFNPDLGWYVGLSGALHGMFVYGAIQDIKVRLNTGWLLLVGVAIKLYFEQTQGASESLGQWIEANVAVDSHLYGAVSGLLLALGVLAWQRLTGGERRQ